MANADLIAQACAHADRLDVACQYSIELKSLLDELVQLDPIPPLVFTLSCMVDRAHLAVEEARSEAYRLRSALSVEANPATGGMGAVAPMSAEHSVAEASGGRLSESNSRQ